MSHSCFAKWKGITTYHHQSMRSGERNLVLARRSPRTAIAIVVAIGVVVAGALMGTPAVAAPATCTLEFTLELPSANTRPLTRDIWVNWDTCSSVASPVRQMTDADLAREVNSAPKGTRIGSAVDPLPKRGATSGGGRFAKPLAAITDDAWARFSTWDCCNIRTAYTHHWQRRSYDGSTVSLVLMSTGGWVNTTTGWFLTGGPESQIWDNSGTMLDTRGYASFNNTTFPCGCQPCNHTLWAGIRSDPTGARTPTFIVTGNLCSGWIHTSPTSGFGTGQEVP